MAFDNSKRTAGDLTQISKLLDRSQKSGFLHFLSNRSRLSQIWRDTVGAAVAAKTAIRSLELGRLTIEVEGPAYLERYQYSLPEWKKRINIEYGDEIVTDIILRTGRS